MGEKSAAEDVGAEVVADVLMLRAPNGGYAPVDVTTASPEVLEAAQQGAKFRRAEFNHRIEGGKKRAGKLDKALLPLFAQGVTVLMAAQVLQGELQPTTAKEAAEVARIFHEIGKSALGRAPADGPIDAAERARLMDDYERLQKQVIARAAVATDQDLAGPLPAGAEIPEPDVWEHEQIPEPDAG